MRGLRYLVYAAASMGLSSAPLHAKPHYVTFSLAQITAPKSINNKGAITGYVDGSAEHGFVRQPDGSAVFFDVPGSNDRGVVPASINDSGDVSGYYFSLDDQTPHAFIRTSDGTITTFRVPRAARSLSS